MDWSAFIGGAVGGALVTGIFAVWLEAIRGRRERSNRFLDLKRERYAELLARVDRFHMGLVDHVDGREPKLESLRGAMELASEIQLLAPARVGDGAVAIVVDLARLYKEYAKPDRARQVDELYAEGWRAKRDGFLEAARADLGTARD